MNSERKTAPAGTGTVVSALHDVQSESELSRTIAVDVLAAFIAVLLQVDRTAAATLLEGVADYIFPQPLLWALQAVKAAITAGCDPTPWSAAVAADRAGIVAPPGLRGQPISYLAALLANPYPPAAADWLKSQILENEARKELEDSTHRVGLAAWRGDLAQLQEIHRSESDRIGRLLSDLVAAHV